MLASAEIDDIDILYKPSAKQILTNRIAKQVMGDTRMFMIIEHGREEKDLQDFVKWAVTYNKLDEPHFPKINSEKVYGYYRSMCESFQGTIQKYKEELPAVLNEYKALHKDDAAIQSLEINVPDGPSNVWLDIMEPTSIAMGRMRCGKNQSLTKLSPAGVIWRSDAVRGLVDSLRHAGENKRFAVYSMLRPEALTHYFMKCHPHAYFEGKIPFNELTPSDVTLICRSALSGYKNGIGEIMTRGLQLMEKSIEKPKWSEWLSNILKECEYAAMEFKGLFCHDHPSTSLNEKDIDLLSKIIDGKLALTSSIKDQFCLCK